MFRLLYSLLNYWRDNSSPIDCLPEDIDSPLNWLPNEIILMIIDLAASRQANKEEEEIEGFTRCGWIQE